MQSGAHAHCCIQSFQSPGGIEGTIGPLPCASAPQGSCHPTVQDALLINSPSHSHSHSLTHSLQSHSPQPHSCIVASGLLLEVVHLHHNPLHCTALAHRKAHTCRQIQLGGVAAPAIPARGKHTPGAAAAAVTSGPSPPGCRPTQLQLQMSYRYVAVIHDAAGTATVPDCSGKQCRDRVSCCSITVTGWQSQRHIGNEQCCWVCWGCCCHSQHSILPPAACGLVLALPHRLLSCLGLHIRLVTAW